MDFTDYFDSDIQFTDFTFPADDTSLFWKNYPPPADWESDSVLSTYKNKVSGWKRPTEVDQSPSLWGSEGIKPNGVV